MKQNAVLAYNHCRVKINQVVLHSSYMTLVSPSRNCTQKQKKLKKVEPYTGRVKKFFQLFQIMSYNYFILKWILFMCIIFRKWKKIPIQDPLFFLIRWRVCVSFPAVVEVDKTLLKYLGQPHLYSANWKSRDRQRKIWISKKVENCSICASYKWVVIQSTVHPI